MERKNFQPRSTVEDNRLIRRVQRDFSAGGFDDIPGNKIPQNGYKFSENYIAKKDGSLAIRGGCQQWSTTLIPVLRTGYSLSKSGATITKTVGDDFTTADAGRWIIYDNGQVDYIKAYVSTTVVTAASTAARTTSTAAKVRDSAHGLHRHDAKSKIVLHIGTRFYVTNDNTISWTRVYGDHQYAPANSASRFQSFKDYVLVFNANGIFKIDLSGALALFYRINTDPPSNRVTENNETNVLVHCYRYIYTMARLSGTAIGRDRLTSGVSIEAESAPVQVGSDYRDYGEIWTQYDVGPGTDTYEINTGAAMNGSWDTIAEWAVVTDGQFHITIDGDDYNIGDCDFSSATTWAKIADVIQDALQVYFSDATCEWDTDHFIIKSPHVGGTVTVTSAGDGGTDIGSVALAMQTGTGTISDEAIDAIKTLATGTSGDFRCPLDSDNVSDSQWTHYAIYRTLDCSAVGKDPNTGEGNDTEQFVWVVDIPVVKAMLVDITRTLTVGACTAIGTAPFTQQDIGSVFYVWDGATIRECLIAGYTSPTVVTLTMPNTGGTTFDDAPACIGAARYDGQDTFGSAMTASRADTGVVTRTAGYSFVAGDVGRRLFWADGTYDRIIEYTDGNTVTVDASTTKSAQGTCLAPRIRSFTDNVADSTLRNRRAGLMAQNRTWIALPTDSSCGAVKNGFLITAPRDGTLISYGQLSDGYEYLMGYHDPYNQVANVDDKIRYCMILGDYLIVMCSHSIVALPLNTYSTKVIEKIALVSKIIPSQTDISTEVGCYDFGSIKVLGNKTQALFRANDQSMRRISASLSGIEISDNLARDRIQKNHLNKLTGASSNSYDKVNGYIINGSNVVI